MAVGPDGFVAVGGDREASIWRSPDGLNWTRVPHDPAVFGSDDSVEINEVTAIGTGFIAVGLLDTRAAIWVSSDGLTWSLVPHEEWLFGGYFGDGGSVFAAEISGVTSHAGAVVAVGSLWPYGDRQEATAWVGSPR